MRMVFEPGEPFAEQCTHVFAARDQVLALDDLQHLVRDRAGSGVGGEGVEHQLLAPLGNRRDHAVRRVYAADRRVAAREALARRP